VRRVAAAAVMVFLAVAAQAQDADEALAPVRACLQAAGGEAEAERGCIGVYADACVARPGGETTVGTSGCLLAEAVAWDRLLNETWGQLLPAARAMSEAESRDGVPPVAREDMLRAAQRAWIAFRDADCDYDVAFWSQGSMRQIAGAQCMLERTGQRVIDLRAKLRLYSN
jgi:uncharacterized protein YecT (DUF1311 family)